MKSSINGELERFKNVLIDDRNKEIVIGILRKALGINITDFRFNELKTLKKITEYDFSVLKFVGSMECKEFEFYIKLIKGGEIKQSVFCCWSLLQEEYESCSKDTEETNILSGKLDKVLIKEDKNEKYTKSVQITLERNINYTFNVNFIELEKFIEKFEPNLLQGVQRIKLSDKDIMLVLIKNMK